MVLLSLPAIFAASHQTSKLIRQSKQAIHDVVHTTGRETSKLIQQGKQDMQAVVHTAGKEMTATIKTAEDALKGLIVEFEQSAGNVVRLAIDEAGDKFEVVAGRLEQSAQVILRNSREEACLFLQEGVRGVQQILRMDVPLSARLVGLEAAQGLADGLSLFRGRVPTQSLLKSVHRRLFDPNTTPSQVLDLINRQGASVPPSEIFGAYQMVLHFYARSELSSEESFLYQLWFYAEAKLKLREVPLSWRHWALSLVCFTPDSWRRLRDILVIINDAALRHRALTCVERIPATSDEGHKNVLLELAGIAYELRSHGQPSVSALPQPELPQVTREMKERLVVSLKDGNVQDVCMAVREMMDIDPESVSQSIQEDCAIITLSKFLAFYRVCSTGDEAKQVLRAFAKRTQSRLDRESTEEVMDLAGYWRKAFPSELLPFDISNVTVASCNMSLQQWQFFCAADTLLLYTILQDNTGRDVVNHLRFGGKSIHETPEVFQLVYALQQRGAQRRLLERFNSTVVALLDGSDRQFCIACRNYVLDGKGCKWGDGPGWYVDSKICPEREKTHSKLWRIKIHDEGKWFSFVTIEDRHLEGGRQAWNDGASYYATTHPSSKVGSWSMMRWKLTPKHNGRFQMHCQHENQRLNAEGRSWGYNKLRATTEKGGRGSEEDKEFSFVFR